MGGAGGGEGGGVYVSPTYDRNSGRNKGGHEVGRALPATSIPHQLVMGPPSMMQKLRASLQATAHEIHNARDQDRV